MKSKREKRRVIWSRELCRRFMVSLVGCNRKGEEESEGDEHEGTIVESCKKKRSW